MPTERAQHTLYKFHPLNEADGIVLPAKFNNPFYYEPHPLCIMAAEEVKAHISEHPEWSSEIEKGKMFGVLVAKDRSDRIGFLAAFSGILCGSNNLPYFVPPVYDLLNPDGYFREEERNISHINTLIDKKENSKEYITLKEAYEQARADESKKMEEARQKSREMKALRNIRRASGNLTPEEEAELVKESQYYSGAKKRLEKLLRANIEKAKAELSTVSEPIEQLKNERKERSAALQHWLFEQFAMFNAKGEKKNLIEIFKDESIPTPPAGSGECCAPKLLQYAYSCGLTPISMAEFWMGQSPKDEIRRQGDFYPSCTSKCKPILKHMLCGLDVEENLLLKRMEEAATHMRIIFEDAHICAIHKPSGMLSVPSKDGAPSVFSKILELKPELNAKTLIVHRLDMDTSGVLLLAKDKKTHRDLQEQFLQHTIKKRYIALLEGHIDSDSGTISLPLSCNFEDRPRHMVDYDNGKDAVTLYHVINSSDNSTRIAFYPQTGRTHQLRVHSAHPEGLGHPIIGDPLYGHKSTRLFLHAESIEFTHPHTGQRMTIESPCEF